MRFTVGGNVAEKLLLANWRHVGNIRTRIRELMEQTELPPSASTTTPTPLVAACSNVSKSPKHYRVAPAYSCSTKSPAASICRYKRVLDLIRRIQWEQQMTMLLVSHDLGVIKQLARRTIVMKNGHIVESGLTDQILEDPQHPYTQLLVSSAL